VHVFSFFRLGRLPESIYLVNYIIIICVNKNIYITLTHNKTTQVYIHPPPEKSLGFIFFRVCVDGFFLRKVNPQWGCVRENMWGKKTGGAAVTCVAALASAPTWQSFPARCGLNALAAAALAAR